MWGFRRSREREKEELEGRGREGGQEGGGEGRSRVLDISDGQRASIRRTGSVMTLEGDLCSSWSNFVDDVASKIRTFFSWKTAWVHEIRTLMLEGPNFVKFFLFLILTNITFSPKRTTGSY